MPKKGELCRLGRWIGSIKDLRKRGVYLLHLPTETRRLLCGDVANPLIGEAIDRCARLYQVALVCGAIYPSVGFAYRVAAVEAIVQTTKEYRGFSDFMRQHVSTRDGLDDLLNYLYHRVRSAHFHGGEFPSGEFARQPFFDPLMDAENVLRTNRHSAGDELIHEAIMGWLAAAVPESPRAMRGA